MFFKNPIALLSHSFPKFIFLILFFMPCLGWAQKSEIFLYNGSLTTQLTYNNYDNSHPLIDNGNIVWYGGPVTSGDRAKIFFYNGSTVIPLGNDSSDAWYENYVTRNGRVAWGALDGNDLEIFFFDGSSTIQITNNDTDDHLIGISGDNSVVWGTNNWQKLFLYTAGQSKMIREYPFSWSSSLSSARVDLASNQIAWREPILINGNTYDQIFMYNGTDSVQITDSPFDYNDRGKSNVAINAGNIIWLANIWSNSIGAWDLELFFYNGANIAQLTSSDQQNYSNAAKIQGNKIIWMEGSPPANLFFYNGSATVQLVNNIPLTDAHLNNGQVTWLQNNGDLYFYNGSSSILLGHNADKPAIHNGQVVWIGYNENYDENSAEIFLYKDGQIAQLTNNNYYDGAPQIYNGLVVWEGRVESGTGTGITIKVQDIDNPDHLLEIDENFKPLLGQRWTFVATTPDGTKVDADWTVRNDSSTMTTPNSALFPETVGIFFDPDTAGSEKQFQTVHLGEVEIKAEATINSQIMQVTKRIAVGRPSRLGGARLTTSYLHPESGQRTYENFCDYDDAIIDTANNTGILPQYIKAQIWKESWEFPGYRFVANSYRYEPHYDFLEISQPDQFVKKPAKRIINTSPYNKYALDDGSGVNLLNRKSRDIYYIDPNWQFPPASWESKDQPATVPDERHINDASDQNFDKNISCANIFYRNDKVNIKQNWSKASSYSIEQLKNYWIKEKKDFIAQTITASSYGLLQMLYQTAVGDGKFGKNPQDPDDDPSSLFVPETNMKVGSRIHLHNFFIEKGRLNLGLPPLVKPIFYYFQYADNTEWRREWINLFQKWNPGEYIEKPYDPYSYGNEIINKSEEFLPQ